MVRWTIALLGIRSKYFFKRNFIQKRVHWSKTTTLSFNFKNNLFSEVIGTFVLVFGVLFIVGPNIQIENHDIQNFGLGSVDALPVGILVWVIGIALGGTTGYAINPARDLGPRIVHQLIPRKNKKTEWNYSWIPVIGPSIGGIIAGLIYLLILN